MSTQPVLKLDDLWKDVTHTSFIFRAAGSVIGDGAKAFLTDWDKITAAVSF